MIHPCLKIRLKPSHHVALQVQYTKTADDRPPVNENAREHIEKILAHMTALPGVYRMLGKDGELLYVGTRRRRRWWRGFMTSKP
jgi:hypothetical protein